MRYPARQRQRHSERGYGNEKVRDFQRKRHTQADAVRGSALREAQGVALYGSIIMIIKNTMQLKAFIKKKASEKNISVQIVMLKLYAGKTAGTNFAAEVQI